MEAKISDLEFGLLCHVLCASLGYLLKVHPQCPISREDQNGVFQKVIMADLIADNVLIGSENK